MGAAPRGDAEFLNKLTGMFGAHIKAAVNHLETQADRNRDFLVDYVDRSAERMLKVYRSDAVRDKQREDKRKPVLSPSQSPMMTRFVLFFFCGRR